MTAHDPDPIASARAPSDGRPVRVVHVLGDFTTGGMEHGVLKLIRGASPGFHHDLVIQREAGALQDLLPEGTTVVSMKKPEGNSIRHLRKLARELKALQPDVVHTRNWIGVDALIAARFAGIRGLVHGEHGWSPDDPRGANKKRRFIRRFVSRWVREFTCVSKDIARWLAEDVRGKAPVTQIYNGVDTEVFKPGADEKHMRAELGIADDAFLITFIGRMDPIKDIPTLLAAYERVRAKVEGARLLLVGYGFDEDKLRAMAGPGVIMPGRRHEVPDILRTSDVFVLPSFNEGISNAILEAMASGLPSIVTRVGGNPELVEDGRTGRLFAPGDVDTLAGALLELASDPGLSKTYGDAARATVLERYSISAMVRGYEAVYARIAGA